MTQQNIPIIDGSGTTREARFEQNTDGSIGARHVAEVDGNAVSKTNGVGFPVVDITGSTGLDYSSNKPTLPNVGANFGTTGIFANWVLLHTIPASSAQIRYVAGVQNLAGINVLLILDDGTAASGSAPSNATLIVLAGAGSAGVPGDAWQSDTFTGRVQIYAAVSTAFVSAWTN